MSELMDFLRQIRLNNSRQWFNANRQRYDYLRENWLNDLQRIINVLASADSRYLRMTPKSATFRIYRDVRFSHDKSPYKTYFSAYFSPYGRQVHAAGFYLHLEPDGEAGLYGGIWTPAAPELKKLRTAIVDNIEEFQQIISDPEMLSVFPDWWGEELKTVPKGYDRNHPLAHLLRRKDYGRFNQCGEEFFLDESWPEKAAQRFLLLKPLVEFIDYSLNEE